MSREMYNAAIYAVNVDLADRGGGSGDCDVVVLPRESPLGRLHGSGHPQAAPPRRGVNGGD